MIADFFRNGISRNKIEVAPPKWALAPEPAPYVIASEGFGAWYRTLIVNYAKHFHYLKRPNHYITARQAPIRLQRTRSPPKKHSTISCSFDNFSELKRAGTPEIQSCCTTQPRALLPQALRGWLPPKLAGPSLPGHRQTRP